MGEFRFLQSEAETNLMGLLAQRDAIKAEPDFDLTDAAFRAKHGIDPVWVENCRRAYRWPTRTPLALLWTGLLSRSTDSLVDPLSIQDGSGDYGYNAAGLWAEVIVKHLTGRISLRKLKNIPFNNSPFNGKRRLALDWVNVSAATQKSLTDLHGMLTVVEGMTPQEAERALLTVLLAAPEPDLVFGKAAQSRTADYPMLVPLVDFADAVSNFITLNSDDGRRAQAFATACLEVALPDRVTTPASINDPSRTSPGDVKSLVKVGSEVTGPLFVEVKDKPVRRQVVEKFLAELKTYDPDASAGYAAFANTEVVEAKLDPASRIPTGHELTRQSGMPVVVWRSPLEMLTQAVAWSGLPVSTVIWLCAHAYLRWLDHIDTGKNGSPAAWAERLTDWGFLDADDAE